MGLFEIEEQVAVQRIDQRSTTEGAGDLCDDVERQFVLLETGEQAQGDTHRRVQVSAGYACGQVNRHAHADAPNNADFPQAEAGPCDFERSHAASAEKNQQRGTEKFGHALAG
ncbi:hypothetical protein D3C77_621960 [compost metagenome]